MSAVMIAAVLAAAAVMLLFARLTSLERRLNRLARVDAKLDALLKHAGIRFDPYQDVPADVREALDRGETILAIKRVRQATGVDLKEAKEYVDEVRRRRENGDTQLNRK